MINKTISHYKIIEKLGDLPQTNESLKVWVSHWMLILSSCFGAVIDRQLNICHKTN